MKGTRALLGIVTTTAFLTGTAWLGCSSSSTSNTPPNQDGGSGEVVVFDHHNPFPDGGPVIVDAGPPTCTNYCMTVLANCTGANDVYANSVAMAGPTLDACMAICAQMGTGTPDAQTGDSITCRLYYAAVAATSPATACPPAGPMGAEVCGARLDNFCKYATALCTTANGNPMPWASAADCKSAMTMYPFDPEAGEYDLNDFNALNCFEHFLIEAYLPPDAGIGDAGAPSQVHCNDLSTNADASACVM